MPPASRQLFERPCELTGRLLPFKPLYHWLEYWGCWVAAGSGRSQSALAQLIEREETGWIRSTSNDGYPREIELLEKALARTRLANRFQFRVLCQLHIGKMTFLQIGQEHGIRRRGVERTLWYAYSSTEAHLVMLDPAMLLRPAPVYVRT